jgi:hypothetical protein
MISKIDAKNSMEIKQNSAKPHQTHLNLEIMALMYHLRGLVHVLFL